MTHVPRTYETSSVVDFLHGLPRAGDNEFCAETEGDCNTEYWVKSVGVIAYGAFGFIVVCGLLMWFFQCCMCCKCCQRRCYCGRCCCCRGSKGKIFYALLLLLAVGSLSAGWSSREACSNMLEHMRESMTDAGALLDVIQAQLDKYGLEFAAMSLVVNAADDCNANIVTNLGNALTQISEKMAGVNLPVGSAEINPMIDYLAENDEFPPDFDKIFGESNEGIVSFMFDGMLAVLAALLLLLAFFACFANCRSKCSDSGPCRCIKCCYIFLVLLIGSIVILFCLFFGSFCLMIAVSVADMCSTEGGPDAVFADLLTGDGALAGLGSMGDVTYWTTCTGVNPLTEPLAAVDVPLDSMANLAGTGFWDTTQDYSDANAGCPAAGATPGNCLACKTDMTSLGNWVEPGRTPMATSRQTVSDFNDMFGCPGPNRFTAPSGNVVPSGGLNAVYSTFVYDALCTDLVEAFFWIYVALTASCFFIVFAFWILPCTSRNGGYSGKEEEDKEDTEDQK